MYDNTDIPGNPSVDWVSKIKLREHIDDGPPLKVLSEADWKFWRENGYIIIHDAVPEENLQAVIDLLWEFQEMAPENPDTWDNNPAREIKMTELKNSGMVEVYNHQALWNNRQHPKVYNAFVDIWGQKDLWVTIDRANLNVPNKNFKGFIHWDIDTSLRPKPVNVQGVLSLNDTTEEMGGFQCIPQLYRQFDEWVKTQPEDRDPFKPDITGFEVEKVTTRAGDLLIWNSMLAHGIRANRSDRPRLAQYISMTPAQEHRDDLREWRIESWKERQAPEGYAFPGDPRQWEKKKYKTAELTELGEKLLGIKKWNA